MERLKLFVQQSSLRYSSFSFTLNNVDNEFLQSLLMRPSIVRAHRKEKQCKTNSIDNSRTTFFRHVVSDLPLTDALLNLVLTCLNSREAMINNEAIQHTIRILFGHAIERSVQYGSN
jgi:hypothetical protein